MLGFRDLSGFAGLVVVLVAIFFFGVSGLFLLLALADERVEGAMSVCGELLDRDARDGLKRWRIRIGRLRCLPRVGSSFVLEHNIAASGNRCRWIMERDRYSV